jgi:glycosyltransferase involved in cell wall biosynthesis
VSSIDDHARPIRVLHVEAGTYFGGSHKALATYLKASAAPNLKHHVLLVHSVPEFETELHGVCPITTLLNNSGVSFGPPTGNWAVLKFWTEQTLRIRRFLASGQFDLVHVNNTFTFQPYTVLACRLAGLPAVVHMRNPVSDSWLARRIAGMSQIIVAVNRDLGRSIQKWRTHDVQICYDGVELGAADPETARQLRETLLGDGTLLIGSVGRLELQKGYDILVEAAKEVIATRPEVRFAVAGEGPLRPALEERIRELGLEQQFRLCGFRSDVATFLEAVDVFVCASRYEGGPMTVVEALLKNKPVVSTAVGFVPELTREGRYADLVPIEDAGALVAAMHRAIDAIGAPRFDSAEGRSRAMEFFEPRGAASRFDALLQAVARRK